jgi:hypothetical protein
MSLTFENMQCKIQGQGSRLKADMRLHAVHFPFQCVMIQIVVRVSHVTPLI